MMLDTASMEQEVKLMAPDAVTLESMLRDPDILEKCGGSPWQSKYLESTYLDTPGRQLLAHRFGFRFRKYGTPPLWRACLKAEGHMVDGFSVRHEWEQEVDGPVDNLAELPDGPLRQQALTVASGGESLLPLVETVFLRKTVMLTLADQCLAELALDQGEIRAGGKTQPLFEVEVECKSGPNEPMLRFSLLLRQRYNLKPSQHSKFAFGLILLDNRP
ncbi:MAG: adenylate cyclase [Magnetococcales bacterium]|nr:adenylate cyclase [Magnetococcales bacterium]